MSFLSRKNKKGSSKGGGIAGLLFGIILFIALTVVLFNNEGVSVRRAKALKNIEDAVEVLSTSVSAENEGALVIFSSSPFTDEMLMDDEFDVIAPKGTIKLSRTVQMYQWHEDSETDDDDVTTYEYYLDWSDNVIDSSDFAKKQGHQNPLSIPYRTIDMMAKNVTMDAFTLDDVFVKKLNNYEPLELTGIQENTLTVTSVEGNAIFQSAEGYSTYQYPELGDILITYEIVSPEMITIVGKQEGAMLKAFETKTGDLAEISTGMKDKQTVMEEKLTQNKIKTFAIRIGSVIGLMLAIAMIFSPLTNLLGRIPLLGNIVNRGIALVGAIIGGAWGLLVIAVGWLFFKPILSISLIVVAVGVVVFFSIRSKKQEEVSESAD